MNANGVAECACLNKSSELLISGWHASTVGFRSARDGKIVQAARYFRHSKPPAFDADPMTQREG